MQISSAQRRTQGGRRFETSWGSFFFSLSSGLDWCFQKRKYKLINNHYSLAFQKGMSSEECKPSSGTLSNSALTRSITSSYQVIMENIFKCQQLDLEPILSRTPQTDVLL